MARFLRVLWARFGWLLILFFLCPVVACIAILVPLFGLTGTSLVGLVSSFGFWGLVVLLVAVIVFGVTWWKRGFWRGLGAGVIVLVVGALLVLIGTGIANSAAVAQVQWQNSDYVRYSGDFGQCPPDGGNAKAVGFDANGKCQYPSQVDRDLATASAMPASQYNPNSEFAKYYGDFTKCPLVNGVAAVGFMSNGMCSYSMQTNAVVATSTPTVLQPTLTPGASLAQGAVTTINGGFQLNPLEGLKYQFDAGCENLPNRDEFPACLLQDVQGGKRTASDAVIAIQQLAAKYGVPSFEGTQLEFANTQAVLVWCPNGGVTYFPPDTAKPLVGAPHGSQWADMLFVVDKATGGPSRRVVTSSAACWMTYRQ